jgi:hypothetical protein
VCSPFFLDALAYSVFVGCHSTGMCPQLKVHKGREFVCSVTENWEAADFGAVAVADYDL